jgi:PKD repeat protein
VVAVRRYVVAFVVVIASAISGVSLAPSGLAATVGLSDPQTGRIVSDDPANFTPHILNGTVYSIVQVGDMVVVGGSFTQVRSNTSSTILTRNRVFAFNANTGVISTTFNPGPNGTVYKVQQATDGTSVYVGGSFTSAGGRSARNLFKMNVATGAFVTGFTPASFDGAVRDLEVISDPNDPDVQRLWVAGKYTHIGGRAQKALGTINATTGAYDPYFTGIMAGTHRDITEFPGDRTNVLQISSNPQNTDLVIIGNFTSVDGLARSQIARINTSDPSSYSVSPWSTNLLTAACSWKFETYVSDVEYSPNGQFFVVATSGAYGGTTGSMNGTIGCDVVARFEASATTSPTPASWTAYTGGDTTWTVEVTDDVVYAGGHQSWQNNPLGGNFPNAGAVERTGVAALNTLNGMPYSWNPTRTRGVGIQDMLATPQGLWIGSDTDRIGNWEYHARIALMPLEGGDELKPMINTTLPAELFSVASGSSQLRQQTFDGTLPPPATSAPNGSVAWGSTTGAFMAHGVLYTGSTDGTFTKRTFDGADYGLASEVNASDALVRQDEWHDLDVANMTSLFWHNGRMYFTRGVQNTLFRRGFEPESDVVGQQRFSSGSVSGIPFASIRGAFVAGDFFYYATSSGLFRAPWGVHAPLPGPPTQLSSSSQFASRAMFAFQGENAEPPPPPPPPPNVPPTASASVSCTLLECSFSSAGTADTDGTFTLLWDFGGGDTTTDANPTRTYSAPGPQTATLTVTDDDNETDVETLNFNVTDVASPVAFEGGAHTNGNRSNHAVTVPAGTEVGDAMVLFFSANTTVPTYTWPEGWTPVGPTFAAGGIVGRAFSKVATAADLGAVVRVTSSAYAKSDMALAVYSGTDATDPIGASAGVLDTTVSASHTSPTVTAPADGKWLVTYWADKSSITSSWTDPPGQTRRSTATGTSGGHITGLLVDSAGDVSGETGGLTATANAIADRAVSYSVVLR